MTGDVMSAWLRRFLGLDVLADRIAGLSHTIHFLGVRMAKATQQIADLSGRFDDFASDVRAALAVINDDQLSPQAQEALDGLSAKLAALDTEVGDADGSDAPVVDVPTEPTDPGTDDGATTRL
jgi:hypothetical protein